MKHRQKTRKKRRLLGVLMIVMALIIMQLPATEAGAVAYSTDFKMNGSTLVKYRGPEKNVTLPDTVEVIGRGAFEDNTNIELVVVPNSVKRIDPYAFWGCDNLDTVVLGKGLTEVGDYAFAGCKGLKQITLPTNITSIGIQAFADCVNMTDIGIPAETVQIHETAFDGCVLLTIHADSHSVAEKFAESFYERQKNMAGYVGEEPASTTAPDETVPSTTEVPIVESMIGTTQIVGNTAVFLLDNQQLPVYEGLPQPESNSLALADLMGDGNIPKYTIVDGIVVADQAYYRNDKLGNVALPDTIKEIGQFSFARSSLSAVKLPQGAERIDYGAFYHCSSLTQVTLPDTIMCVEPKAFSYTPWVDHFMAGGVGTGDFLVEGGVLVAYRGKAQNVIIPEGVRVIAAEAFQNHTEIKTLSLPDSLLVIGEGAFEGCSQLHKITFGQNVEEIKDRAFYGISPMLGSVALPASVKKLGLNAFGNVWVTYEGEEPEHTYETSATRLSNTTYRVYSNMGAQTPNMTVIGLEGASATLEGADRSYTLEIEILPDSSEMEEACQRTFMASLPQGRVIYNLTLMDDSHIPLTKLGSQMLTVVLPVPETLAGQKLKFLALDRNGQPEAVAVERVLADGIDSFRFQTNHLSLFAIYGIGIAEDGEIMETNVSVNSLSNLPNITEDSSIPHRPHLWVGGALLLTGLILLLTGSSKQRRLPLKK